MADPIMENLTQIAVKKEATLGTFLAPVAADAAFLVHDVDMVPVVDAFINQPMRATYTQKKAIIGGRARRLSFGADLLGSGAVNTPPKIGVLLETCGFEETVTDVVKFTIGAVAGGPFQAGERITGVADFVGICILEVADGTTTLWAWKISGTPAIEVLTGSTSSASATASAQVVTASTAYRPRSDQTTVPGASIAGYFGADSANAALETMRGSRGNLTFACQRGQPVRINCEYQGVMRESGPDSAMLSGIPFETTDPPPFIGVAMLINGIAIPFETLAINMQNEIQPRPDANDADGFLSFHIGNRAPQMTVDIEALLKAGFDYEGLMLAGTTFAVQLTVGTVAGNTFLFSAPNGQFQELRPGARNTIRTKDPTILLTGVDVDGEDELFVLQI